MVRAMRAIRLLCGTAILGLGLGCAPVQGKTHFQRWDEHSAKIQAEEAAEADAAPAPAGKAAPAKATPAARATPPPASAPVYGSGSSTPPITKTATASRVIRPGDAPATGDDDAIY